MSLTYDEEQKLAVMPTTELDAFEGEYFASTRGIRDSGQYVAGEALQPVHTAVTVRVRHGRVPAGDGPFAKSEEQLGGFYLVEARELNEAIQVPARIRSACIRGIVVRPVVDSASRRRRRSISGAAPPSPGCRRASRVRGVSSSRAGAAVS